MKNAYYVYSIGKKGYSEWQEGKYDTLDEARRAANDIEYSRKQGKDKGSVEIRQYAGDIEDEDCTNFDYNTFSFEEQTITTIENNRNEILDEMEELEKNAINGNGLYYSLYMDENGALSTDCEANADSWPSGAGVCLRQVHYSKDDLDSEIMNIVEENYGDMITALKAHLTEQCAPGIIDDGVEDVEYIDSNYPDARESLEDECKEAILDSIDFNDILDWKIEEIRDCE